MVNSSDVLFGQRNIMHVRVFIIIMFAYSARKNSANGPAAYSTLNPDTSSDSPSVRSNGARLVSAMVEMYHIIIRGHEQVISQVDSCVIKNICMVKPPVRAISDNKIMPRVTSYEIVWATARSAPISAYFELEAQPDHRREYTDRLEIARIISSPRLSSRRGFGMGRGAQMRSASKSARVGIAMKSVMEEVVGRSGSLVNNLTPSAIG